MAELNRRDFIKVSLALFALTALGVGFKKMDFLKSVADSSSSAASDTGAYNFQAIYGDPKLKAAFLDFLTNVYRLYPEHDFHELITEVCQNYKTDHDIYQALQKQLPKIKPLLGSLTYAYPSLKKQKSIMAQQTQTHLQGVSEIDGYMEIGSPARYVSALRKTIPVKGDVIVLHTDDPKYSPVDILERGQISKLGRFVPMGNYDPISNDDVKSDSLSVVANYIGLHHSPREKLSEFVASIHRVLKPKGRFVLRDHDVTDASMNHLVGLAHDVFNAGLEQPWQINFQELRFFTSLKDIEALLIPIGFKKIGNDLYQDGDPTKNALMCFEKV